MAKILVTGGAGFIGSHVVELFLSRGFEVIILDDLSTGRASNINPQAKFYQMDIRNPEIRKIFEAERPDYISHHAAQMDVRRSVAQPLFDADVNILGSINLIECAREFNVKHFVYISTGGAVYGEPEKLPCDESHPISDLIKIKSITIHFSSLIYPVGCIAMVLHYSQYWSSFRVPAFSGFNSPSKQKVGPVLDFALCDEPPRGPAPE